MPSDQTFEQRAHACLTPTQEHASQLRVSIRHAANAGMRDEWRLREHGQRIRTEAHLQAVLATVPTARRRRLETRIRPYCQIAN